MTNCKFFFEDIQRMAFSVRWIVVVLVLCNVTSKSSATDYTFTGWGIEDVNYGRLNTPQGLSGVMSVDGFFGGTIVLLSNGTVVQWGLGLQAAPANLNSVLEIDAGFAWVLSRLADGSLRCWGANDSGQISGIPSGNDFIQIAAGNMHGLALKNNGTVFGWGRNDMGQSNIPAGLTNVIAISAHGHNSLALKSDGTVIGWGNSGSGINNVPVGLSGVQKIACGDTFALALKADGSVVAWGSNNYGQANVPSGLKDVEKIFAEGLTAYAILKNGTAVAWGYKSADYLKLPELPQGYVWHSIRGGWEHMYGLAQQLSPVDLIALSLNVGTLNPAFFSSTTAYTANVSNATTSIIVTATLAQADSTIDVRVNGGTFAAATSGSPSAALALNVGANTVDVRVTAQDGITQKIYSVTVTREKASQMITFAAIPDKLTTDFVNLTATGGESGNPVTFGVTSGPGVITNNVLTFTAAGRVTVTASQAGNANYLPAVDVTRAFNVTKATALVTLGSLSQTFNMTPRAALATTVPAGLTVNFTYGGSATPPTNAGSYAVVATVNDLIYQGSATGTLEIGKAAQAITFAAIPDKLTTDSVNLTATGGDSANQVTFAVTSGPGVITNNVLTFTTSGSVTVTASQAGNANYLAAPDVSRTFNVTKATATVMLGSLAQTYNTTPRSATATTDPAGLSNEFTYDGSPNPPTNAGTYAVVATINDLIYQGSATGTLEIGKDSQTISFAAISDKLTTDSVYLTATGGGSANPVTFAVTSGPAVITNNVLTFTTSGTVTITASQAGNGNYMAAEDVSRTFNVTMTEAPITFAQLSQVANGTPRPVSVSTTPSDLTVTTLYAGSSTAPTLPGSYAVSSTIEDPIYQGTASASLTVLGLTGLEKPILSGSTTPVVINGTDYGNVILGRVLTRVFTLSNPGSQPITLSGNPLVEVEGDHAGDFQFSVLPDAVIPAGGSVSFELRFAPTQPGARTARVKLACAALTNGPITFAVQGFGALPAPRTQTITFAPPATLYLSQSPLQLIATASSGLPVSLQVISGPATLDQDGLLTLSSAGTVKVEARQEGNGSFAVAPSVQRKITVKPDPTTLALVDLIKTYNGQPQEAGVVGVGDVDVLVTYKVGATYSEAPPVNAGQYPVKAVAGTVTKTGTLVINQAPLVVNVEDKRRLVGEDNPPITVIFEGFIGTDNSGLVLTKPINLATTATKTSPVGSYPITSSGGAVTTNYRLVHRPGTLVVEGVAGSYEALLRHPTSGLPNGHLALTVPGASRTFTASLRLGQETAPISWNGSLALSAQSRLATATLSKSVSGVAYELKVVLSMFGELSCEVRRARELVAASDDGIRLLTLATGQKAAQEGNYTAILEPAKPAAASVPVGAGWATGKVDSKGLLTLTGRLGDGTSFTAGMAADVAEKPGYRLFIQPYLPARRGSHLGGSFTLTPHPRHAGRSYVAGSDLSWVKVGQLKDLGYRTDFGPVTTTLRLDPWQAPSTTNRLATRLELAADGRWEVDHSDTGSLSHGALPTAVEVNATNVVSVVKPQANTRKWKITLTPATGAYTGSFELQELTESRRVNFSGVLRQTPTLADDLIGAGHYLLPALKTDLNQEQQTGAVLFWRPE